MLEFCFWENKKSNFSNFSSRNSIPIIFFGADDRWFLVMTCPWVHPLGRLGFQHVAPQGLRAFCIVDVFFFGCLVRVLWLHKYQKPKKHTSTIYDDLKKQIQKSGWFGYLWYLDVFGDFHHLMGGWFLRTPWQPATHQIPWFQCDGWHWQWKIWWVETIRLIFKKVLYTTNEFRDWKNSWRVLQKNNPTQQKQYTRRI